MLQLIILGNGFDLHCGLKSSYRDFFRHDILDTTVESFQIKRMIINNPGFWENLLFKYYEVYGDKDYNWCDIENIIKNTLWHIFYGYDYNTTDLKNGLFCEALKTFKDNRFLLNKQAYDDKIQNYIFVFCIEFLQTINLEEKTFFDILHLFSLELLKNLHILEQRFCNYLKNQIVNPNNKQQINQDYILKAANLIMAISGFNYNFQNLKDIIYEDLGEVLTETQFGPKIDLCYKNYLTKYFLNLMETHVIDFNYTNFFDFLEVQTPCNFNNVHGKLCNLSCDKCNSSQIIFGIDDTLISTKNTNSDLRLFSKTYRKMISQSLPANILPPNDNIITIKFYGHSLSEADYSYFQSIFDYYNLYSNNKINLNFYYSKGYEQNDEIYKLLNSYGKTFSNQDQGKNLIHKLLLENRLSITEIS